MYVNCLIKYVHMVHIPLGSFVKCLCDSQYKCFNIQGALNSMHLYVVFILSGFII